MAEPTTNYIEIDGEGKYIEDTEAREGVAQNAADIANLISSLQWQNKTTDFPLSYDTTKINTIYIYKQEINVGLKLAHLHIEFTPKINLTNAKDIITGMKMPNNRCVLTISSGDAVKPSYFFFSQTETYITVEKDVGYILDGFYRIN